MLSALYWAHKDLIMASKYPQIRKHGTAGKWKHVALLIPQKLETIRSLKAKKATVWLWLHTRLDADPSGCAV
jgi:hypothetical protein